MMASDIQSWVQLERPNCYTPLTDFYLSLLTSSHEMNKDREIQLLCSMDLDILKHYCLNKAMEIGQNRLSWGL